MRLPLHCPRRKGGEDFWNRVDQVGKEFLIEESRDAQQSPRPVVLFVKLFWASVYFWLR
jgi:hypothetical protein